MTNEISMSHIAKATVSSGGWSIVVVVALALAGACHRKPPEPSHTDSLGLERIPDDEPIAIEETAALLRQFIGKTYPDGVRPARRDAHAKAHGCVKAEVTVPELPERLRVGVFAKPRTYYAWIRYSNGNPTPQPDHVGDGRGMAIKLMGVEGKKILADEIDETTQDFVMINHPVFFVDTAANYLSFTKAQEGGNTLSYFIGLRNPLDWHVKAAEIALAITKHEVVNPLETRYWSMAPYLFGVHAVKYSAKPCVIHEGEYTQTESPDFLADNMEKNLQAGEGCFKLMAQFQSNAEDMPVENPMVEWDEDASPFIEVASIRIPSQTFRDPEQIQFCENLSFTPWHALPVHRPLGGINRLRRVVYETISRMRHELNAAPRREPTAGPDFLAGTGASP